MIELGGELSLGQEALQEAFIAGQRLRQLLEGDLSLQVVVLADEDLTHRALADQAEQGIGALRADCGVGPLPRLLGRETISQISHIRDLRPTADPDHIEHLFPGYLSLLVQILREQRDIPCPGSLAEERKVLVEPIELVG